MMATFEARKIDLKPDEKRDVRIRVPESLADLLKSARACCLVRVQTWVGFALSPLHECVLRVVADRSLLAPNVARHCLELR